MLNKSKHVVFCDGGLSNRLNALIFALILKEKYKQDWELSWPVNNWCGASLEELFDTEIEINQKNLSAYKEIEDEYLLVMHENQCNFTPEKIIFQSTLHGYEDFEVLMQQKKPILYYNNLIPNFSTISDIQGALKLLSLNKELQNKAHEFCISNHINDSVFGLHIRKTDFGNTVNEQALYEIAENNPNRFFVCSDDQEVNKKFSGLSNCCVYEKTHFPMKMNEKSMWQDATVDDQNRQFNFNITRSEQSIREALIDLLILSRTTHINTSQSTFLRMSMLFKQTKFF